MEIKLKTILKELGIALGLGFVAYLLGGNFGTAFILTLLIRYCTRK